MILWLSMLAVAHAAPPSEHVPRTWIDDSGAFRLEAKFLAFHGDHVTLQRADEREVAVPISRLSEPDKSFLRRFALVDETAAGAWPALFAGPGE